MMSTLHSGERYKRTGEILPDSALGANVVVTK
jgi:hypothetical protein